MESTSALRVCAGQLHTTAVAYDPQARSYRVARASFSRVEMVGVLVKRTDSQLKLDDGTGLLDVKVTPNIPQRELQKLQLGALVECTGSIEEPWPPSDMTRSRRWMNATRVREVHDRNIETLRMLEVIHMFKNDYAVSPATAPAALELLAFPPAKEGNARQSVIPESGQNGVSIQQRKSDKQSPANSTIIEKPWEQQRFGAPYLEGAIPPADYQFHLPDRDQMLVEQGTKSLEIRLNVAPYSIIHVNDRITINGKTTTTVAAVRKYSQLQSVVEAENLDALLPQSSFVGSGNFNAVAAAERHCRQFFSAEEEQQFGIVVFQLAVTSSGPKSQEEWSNLILGQLEAKRATGCSIADLRFAFPALPTDQITEILTNLQFDALVVCMNGKYRLV